ncbi:hypothetical protein QE394_001024 [Arthrobacter sp. SORGH_AS 212]|nr:hypothetical protein [Arthrobacter sp. SORGH_AS_0212]
MTKTASTASTTTLHGNGMFGTKFSNAKRMTKGTDQYVSLVSLPRASSLEAALWPH